MCVPTSGDAGETNYQGATMGNSKQRTATEPRTYRRRLTRAKMRKQLREEKRYTEKFREWAEWRVQTVRDILAGE